MPRSDALKFFLASLCDLKVPPEERKRLGLRYPKTPEVQRLLKKLHRCKIAEKEIVNTDVNAIISTLKEVLSEFPGDLLLLFTPVLFPNSVGDVTKFLRATRISLIMIDLCDTVFQPLIIAQGSLTDSAYHSDEDFFNDLFKNLDRLQDSFCETDSETEDDGYADSFESEPSEKKSTTDESANTQYYQITYVD
ncbi:hypothetical protein AAVH_02647 [Aphelenchoides avenae]|nr:hypothetical protein AAVH_02647 [Aphelenchus avenae]